MYLSGLRETISTREKSLPERSRMVGSVSGKSIIVPRIGPLGQGANWPHRITNAAQSGKERGSGWEAMRLPTSGQFQLQSGLISGRMQQTAEATASRLRWPEFLDCR